MSFSRPSAPPQRHGIQVAFTDAKNDDLRVSFDSRLRVKFLGSQITTDAGLLAYRELDEVLGLTEMGTDVNGINISVSP